MNRLPRTLAALALSLAVAAPAALANGANQRIYGWELFARPAASAAAELPAAQPGEYDLPGVPWARVYIPRSYNPAKPAPLALLLHGSGDRGTTMISEFAGLADLHGVILIAPDSQRYSWDIMVKGAELRNTTRIPSWGNDVDRIDKALARAFALYNVDAKNVSLIGFSDGAGYGLSLGANNGKLFSAVMAFAPGLLARLPKPGPWMDAFKKLLAFPMYAAAGWLVWVLTLQAGPEALARILAAGVALACAAWLAGEAQRRRAAGARPLLSGGFAAAFGAAALGVALLPAYAAPGGEGEAAELSSEAWSPERVAALQAEGRPVLVNFTAAWCVSCQVNDRVALSTRGVADAMQGLNVAYLKADWTRKDEVIAAELARHGRAGVPLYLVYGARGGEPAILPNILTEGAVVKALERAAKGL